jgi:signal transduction histidine kinase
MHGIVISKHIKKMILASFGITIILVLGLGVFSMIKMMELAKQTEDLYNHPFSVTSSVKNIQLNFISMHRYMKDIPLSKNDEQLQRALKEINISEVAIHREFDFIIGRYLGDKRDIEEVQEAFLEWKVMLDECIKLVKKGKKDEAACLTRNEGERQIKQLEEHISHLINFARNKADHFLKSSNDTMYTSVYVIATLLPLIIFVIVAIMIFLLKGMLRVYTHLEQQKELLLMQSRMAQMGEMISMIAHQWKQPLSVIASIAMDIKLKLSMERFDLTHKEERERCVNFILESTDKIDTQMQSLVVTLNDFRNFFKPNRDSSCVSLSQPIGKALTLINSSLLSDGIELTEDYDSDIKLTMYENEFIQVILNILNNAHDNFKEKGIKDPKISLSTKTNDNTITLSICDNGGGIPDDILDQIFDPYFSTKNEENGTGIGLHMSKIIIEDHHNGTLKAINNNEGVCFILELKLDKLQP